MEKTVAVKTRLDFDIPWPQKPIYHISVLPRSIAAKVILPFTLELNDKEENELKNKIRVALEEIVIDEKTS